MDSMESFGFMSKKSKKGFSLGLFKAKKKVKSMIFSVCHVLTPKTLSSMASQNILSQFVMLKILKS
jgi:hypothetical protein